MGHAPAVLFWGQPQLSLSPVILLPTVATTAKPWTSSCFRMTKYSWRKFIASHWAGPGLHPWACGLQCFHSLNYSHRQTAHQPRSALVSFSGEEIPKACDCIYLLVNPFSLSSVKIHRINRKSWSLKINLTCIILIILDTRDKHRERCHSCDQLFYNLRVLLIILNV